MDASAQLWMTLRAPSVAIKLAFLAWFLLLGSLGSIFHSLNCVFS
jgi:hypothetical protein